MIRKLIGAVMMIAVVGVFYYTTMNEPQHDILAEMKKEHEIRDLRDMKRSPYYFKNLPTAAPASASVSASASVHKAHTRKTASIQTKHHESQEPADGYRQTASLQTIEQTPN